MNTVTRKRESRSSKYSRSPINTAINRKTIIFVKRSSNPLAQRYFLFCVFIAFSIYFDFTEKVFFVLVEYIPVLVQNIFHKKI